MSTTQAAIDARDLFQTAYENRYTWDENFPGFTADLSLTSNGETITGQVRVDQNLSYEVSGVTNEQALEQLKGFVWEVVTHRKRTPFAKAHGKNSFTLGNTDETGAVEILVKGDSMGSNYRLRNNEICEVSRVMNDTAFVINHKTSLDTGSGYISTGYDIVFRDAQTGDLIRQQTVELSYEKMGNYFMLTHEHVESIDQGQQSTKDAVFSNIQFLG